MKANWHVFKQNGNESLIITLAEFEKLEKAGNLFNNKELVRYEVTSDNFEKLKQAEGTVVFKGYY